MFGSGKTKINTDKEKVEDLLIRGVEDVFVRENLEKKLLSGEQLRIKLGFDPTGSKIHIGRAVVLRKLKAFQDLGHQIVFIVGDFTAQIGDPSDKIQKRPMLSKKNVLENIKDYKNQVGKIIDVSKAEFCFNSQWLSKLGFQEISELAESFSVQQMMARRNFKDRFENGTEVSLREFLYPLMQGYDSVAINADVEIGGFDQLFNLKAGRIIQRHYGKLEQDVLTVKMLEGTDGRKMSTSWGNVINITDEPNDMYGKVMSVKDGLIYNYFVLCTEISKKEIDEIVASLEQKENYKEIKSRLAREIVTLYYNKEAAEKAEQNWNKTFSEGGVPDDVLTLTVTSDALLVDILLAEKVVDSKTDWRRLVENGAVTNMDTGEKIFDDKIKAVAGTYKIGKKRFVKIVTK
jgi:tyrosyl-tRNA synthetase